MNDADGARGHEATLIGHIGVAVSSGPFNRKRPCADRTGSPWEGDGIACQGSCR